MACPQPLMDQDAAIATLLAGEPTITLDTDTLTIDGGGDGTLVMEGS